MFSTTVAIPWPTPMHIVARPYRTLRRASSCTSVAMMRTPLAPSGWPSAIAPPFVLTRCGSSSRSRTQAITCDAKASFSSTQSISAALSPARARAFCEAGIGPRPMQDGSTPALAGGRIRASGLERRGIPCRHRPVLLESRLQRRQLLEAGIRPRPLVALERAATGQGDRHQLVAKMAGLLGGDRLPMAFERPAILVLAADAVPPGDHLRGLPEADGPVFLELRVGHAPAERAVMEGLGAACELTLGLFEDVGGTGHALDATGQKAGAVPGFDLAGCRHHRLHPRAAQPVHGGRGDLDRQSREQHRHARHVAVILSRLVRVAEVHVLDGRRIHVVSLHRLADN